MQIIVKGQAKWNNQIVVKTEVQKQITKARITLVVLVILMPIIVVLGVISGFSGWYCVGVKGSAIIGCALGGLFLSFAFMVMLLIADIICAVKASHRLEHLKSIPRNKQKGAIYTVSKKPRRWRL